MVGVGATLQSADHMKKSRNEIPREPSFAEDLFHVPEGLKEEKDATAPAARRHGSWLVILGIKAELVTLLVEAPAVVEEM